MWFPIACIRLGYICLNSHLKVSRISKYLVTGWLFFNIFLKRKPIFFSVLKYLVLVSRQNNNLCNAPTPLRQFESLERVCFTWI